MGRVLLYSDDQVEQPDLSGTNVSLDGTTISAICDSTGIFVLHDVPTGIYTVRPLKEGYFGQVYTGFQFVGGGTALFGPVSLYEHPTFQVVSTSMYSDSAFNFIRIDGIVSRIPKGQFGIMLCYDTTRAVSSSRYLFLESAYTYGLDSSFSRVVVLYPSIRSEYSLRSGHMMYVRAYPASGPITLYNLMTGKSEPTGFHSTISVVDSVRIP